MSENADRGVAASHGSSRCEQMPKEVFRLVCAAWGVIDGTEDHVDGVAWPQKIRVPIGIADRNGKQIYLGDTLQFDPEEWGGECEFVIEIKEGQIVGKGTPDDWNNYCAVV